MLLMLLIAQISKKNTQTNTCAILGHVFYQALLYNDRRCTKYNPIFKMSLRGFVSLGMGFEDVFDNTVTRY